MSSDSSPETSDYDITTTEAKAGGENLGDLMKRDYVYPSPLDPEFQSKIYRKREFYYNKIPSRPEMKEYADIKEYRDNICGRKFALYEHQSFLSNFVNPDTPYRGALVFHGTGTGKCLAKDQRVLVNGSYIKIEDVWKKYHTRAISDGEGDWSLPGDTLEVNSLDSNHSCVKGSVKHLYRQFVNEEMRVVTLSSGKKITITNKHSLLGQNGWTNTLAVGDRVAVPKKIVCRNINNDIELAYLLGWQISEGHERKNNGLLITNNDIGVLNRLQNYFILLANRYGFVSNTPSIKYPENRVPHLQIYSIGYRNFLSTDLDYKWGSLSRDKRFPQYIMEGNTAVKKCFLKAYFDAEAHVSEKNRVIEISSASNVVINQLCTLLHEFGINMRTKTAMKMATNGSRIKREYNLGFISANSLRIFNSGIGFGNDMKGTRLQTICEYNINPNAVSYGVSNILKSIKHDMNVPNEVFVHHGYVTSSKQVGHENLKQIINNLKKLNSGNYPLSIRNRNKLTIDHNKLSQYIQDLNSKINGNVNYEEIVSIKHIKYEDYVYDLEVENYHNFVAEGILCHNTCVGVAIGEKFKSMVQKYNTKIYVLVSGPLIRESWKSHLLKCTGETYMKYQDNSVYIDEQEKNKATKNAINQALQYYRFMSYRSFYKKVLGEKIKEKKTTDDNKVKMSYRKNEEGEFERDIAVDRIYNLNNSLIIVDEAHNLTGNAYGEALMKIIKASTNLRIVLLTATPMKNLADDIVELINFLRPPTAPMERDRIFNSYKNHEMNFREGGLEYLKKMTQGYVSYLRGADPVTFAKRVEKGTIPKGLLFTSVIPCRMAAFQHGVYDEAVREQDDTLDRRSEAVANFVFPGLSQDRKSLIGYYGREGLSLVLNQLKTHHDLINKKIASDLLGDFDTENESELLYMSETNKTITGAILKMKYLKLFSTKFYRAMKKINRLVWGRKGARTAFVYSNLVKVGIELFQEILIQNGWLEFQENYSNYTVTNTTICHFCGKTYKEHQGMTVVQKLVQQSRVKKKDSESSTEYTKKTGPIPDHKFYPAAFISVTGSSSDETADVIPEDKKRILDNVFNNIENREGRYIKLVLGSKVMNEGISLFNVAEVHILDVYFNLGKVDQVIGRAIRYCSHYNIITDENRYPKVNVYKYAVTLERDELSSEEDLYRKAERKYILIKRTERAIKETAIDCPLNRSGNIFAEEVKKFEKCIPPQDNKGDKDASCPLICDYMQCDFRCHGGILNAEYYDPDRRLYRHISKEGLDYSTFTNALAQNEIDHAKRRVKELYRTKYVYTLPNIVDYVKSSYDTERKDLFDPFFVYKALDELIPVTENDFNNFHDTILDKYNQPGYLIYVHHYYIFQPIDQNEDVPMYYRTSFDKPIVNKLSLYNFLKSTHEYKEFKQKSEKVKSKSIGNNLFKDDHAAYDFEAVREYYDGRDEYKFVGIIDKEPSRRKNKRPEEMDDVFKIREKRAKVLDKKRGTGIPSIKGAVCATSKSKEYLESIAGDLKLKLDGNETRIEVCNLIRDRMIDMEKYGDGKRKVTYIMVPKNHPDFPFPLNLEDRLAVLKNDIRSKIKFKLDSSVKHEKHKSGNNKGKNYYVYRIKHQKSLDEFKDVLIRLGGELQKDHWTFILE